MIKYFILISYLSGWPLPIGEFSTLDECEKAWKTIASNYYNPDIATSKNWYRKKPYQCIENNKQVVPNP